MSDEHRRDAEDAEQTLNHRVTEGHRVTKKEDCSVAHENHPSRADMQGDLSECAE